MFADVFPAVGTVAPIPCGNSSVYCPSGSSSPSSPETGYYSTGGTNSSTYSAQAVCPAGYYCTGGVKIGCPAGTFFGSQGASQSTVCQQCPAGSYCGFASTAGTLCGSSDDVYCPLGSSFPRPVDSGYFSTGTPGLRSGESICPSGQYCVGGVNYTCPAGLYGSSAGLNSSSCSGSCSAGEGIVLMWSFSSSLPRACCVISYFIFAVFRCRLLLPKRVHIRDPVAMPGRIVLHFWPPYQLSDWKLQSIHRGLIAVIMCELLCRTVQCRHGGQLICNLRVVPHARELRPWCFRVLAGHHRCVVWVSCVFCGDEIVFACACTGVVAANPPPIVPGLSDGALPACRTRFALCSTPASLSQRTR